MIQTIDSTRLHWDAPTQTFSGESSDLFGPLRSRPRGLPRMVNIQSAHTGAIKLFHMTGVETDREGDLLATVYKHQDGYVLRVWND